MAQALKERKPDQNLPASRKRQPLPISSEHHLERKSRLRIEEADARCQRWVRMILLGSAVIVILNACIASTLLLISKSSTQNDRQLAFYVLGQIIAILIGVLLGKNINWKN